MGDSTEESSGVLSRTASLLNSSRFSDVEFLIKNGPESVKFHAHKLILAMASKIFAKKFYSSSNNSLQIKITDSSPSAFFCMLQYIYTDKLDLTDLKEAKEIYSLATQYEIRELEEKCVSFISANNVTLDNLFIKYECALKENLKDLLHLCRNLICGETKAALESSQFKEAPLMVVEDIIKQDNLDVDNELDIINAVLKWARSECQRRSLPYEDFCLRDCIEPLLKHIRLLSLTPEEFCDFVDKHDIFTSAESSILTRKLLQPDCKVRVPETFCPIAKKRRLKSPKSIGHETEARIFNIGLKTLNLYNNGKETKAVNMPVELGIHQPIHRNDKIRYSHTFEDQASRTVQQMKNRSTLTAYPFFHTRQHMTYDFPLSDGPKGIGSAFSNDIKCAAKIHVLRGKLLLHGIQLKLKNLKVEPDELEVHMCLSGFLEEPETCVYKQDLNNDIFSITLSEPKVLLQNKKYEVEIMVEDVKLNRCSVCRVKKCELNCSLDITAEINLISNQSYEDGFYFLISRFVYSPY